VDLNILGESKGTRPKFEQRPKTPHTELGTRIEPPPSYPIANGTIFKATLAADPDDDPPVRYKSFHGLKVPFSFALYPIGDVPYSVKEVFPTITQPDAFKRETIVSSFVALLKAE
jgi:hypothetical protein